MRCGTKLCTADAVGEKFVAHDHRGIGQPVLVDEDGRRDKVAKHCLGSYAL